MDAKEIWMREARRYAKHIWCYEDLIDDHPESTEAAFNAGLDVYSYVEDLGDKYDLDRADQNWGINSDTLFEKKITKLEPINK
jgi:hypothetical protein